MYVCRLKENMCTICVYAYVFVHIHVQHQQSCTYQSENNQSRSFWSVKKRLLVCQRPYVCQRAECMYKGYVYVHARVSHIQAKSRHTHTHTHTHTNTRYAVCSSLPPHACTCAHRHTCKHTPSRHAHRHIYTHVQTFQYKRFTQDTRADLQFVPSLHPQLLERTCVCTYMPTH